MRRGLLSDLARRLRTLRCPAVLRVDGSDEQIGGCRERDLGDNSDGRCKWYWWYDATLCEEAYARRRS